VIPVQATLHQSFFVNNIMELEKQVCSLELAKKLKELGVKKRGAFTWVLCTESEEYKLETFSTQFRGAIHNYYAMGYDGSDGVTRNAPKGFGEMFPAFTVAELGEILPQILKISKTSYQLFVSVALDKQWFVVYANEMDYHDNAPIKFMMCHNEADARAKMLIYLIENKLIKIPD
jgi:hypothetical protein